MIGANAVFIYMFARTVPLGQWVMIFTRSAVGPSGHLEPLPRAVVVLVAEWLILSWMHRAKVLIKT